MINISYFKKFSTPPEEMDFELVINKTRNDSFKKRTIKIRNLLSGNKNKEASLMKRAGPAIAPSGVFKKRRKLEFIQQYNPFFVLDIDNIPVNQLPTLKEKAVSVHYTRACFVSPSGKGLKIFVMSNNTIDDHESSFNKIANYYEKNLDFKIDRSGKDISRLCFLSYDPECYYNPDSEIYPSVINTIGYGFVDDEYNLTEIMAKTIAFTEKHQKYFQGNRNNFVHQFACNANRNGIDIEDTIIYTCNTFDLSNNEITNVIKSAYKNNTNEFATFANVATTCNAEPPIKKTNDYLMDSPMFPDEIFTNMPSLIQRCIAPFTDKRERDVVFTSLITVLSGILPNVTGTYSQEVINTNLFSFIIAPSAAGKGVMKFAQTLAQSVDEYLIQKSNQAFLEYQEELRRFEDNNDEDSNNRPPDKPLLKSLLIPGNTSYAKFMTHLKQNGGYGLTFETEADALGYALSKDWGSFSDLLRKAFHHETISASRMYDNSDIRISAPKLSICLSGTPNQVLQLIPSSEDGLFSRFIYYLFNTPIHWKDVSPDGYSQNLTSYFSLISDETKDIYVHNENNPLQVVLTPNQWNKLNNHFKKMISNTALFNNPDSTSIVKRLGLTTFRICMIFTAIRWFEEENTQSTRECLDTDLNIILSIVDVLLHHSLLLFNNLQSNNKALIINKYSNKHKLFDSLPEDFSRLEAITLGEQLSISKRTVDGFLRSLVGIHLSKPSNGHYQKIKS